MEGDEFRTVGKRKKEGCGIKKKGEKGKALGACS